MRPMGRSIDVDGLVNARDLGGLRRRDGTLTPRGVFFRSENIDWVRPTGWDQLRALGVRTLIDLRQPAERARDTQARPPWLTTVAVDLDGPENTTFWKDYWDNGLCGTALYFIPHLVAMPERAGRVLSALAHAPAGGVLFHCMSGRDRTGLISLLLLTAADAELEEIVLDYMETVRLGDIRAAAAKGKNAEPMWEDICATRGTTTEGAFWTCSRTGSVFGKIFFGINTRRKKDRSSIKAGPVIFTRSIADPALRFRCRGLPWRGCISSHQRYLSVSRSRAFRDAIRRLDLTWLYTAAQMDPRDVDAIRTWRGSIPG